MNRSLDGRASAALVILCASWGLNQVAVKLALAGIPPMLQMGLRSLLAAVLVYAWCRIRRIEVFGRDRTLVPGIAAGLLFGVEFMLLYAGLTLTTASRAAVLLYLAPFHVALGAHFLLGERLTLRKTLGLAGAFSGVVLVFSGGGTAVPAGASLLGDALCVAASVAWAATTLVIKGSVLRSAPAEKTLLYQLALSAALGLPVSLLVGETVGDWLDPVVFSAFAYQVLWVASITFVIWFMLMSRYPASLLSSYTFLTPVFGVLFGALLLGEPVTWRLVAALVLVAAGIYLVNRPERPAAKVAATARDA